jgi:TM2 domain-containing membrane protein YozV
MSKIIDQGAVMTNFPDPSMSEFNSGPKPDASKKIAAGVCGILLGALGIHKFILGYKAEGLIMLLVTILTCGLAGIIFGIIGLVEGILYLTKSDDEFVQTYVVNKRGWF